MEEADTQAKQKSLLTAVGAKASVYVWPIALVAIIGLIWFGYDKWQYDHSHVYTDNAQIQGRILKIFSSENGFLEKLYVDNNSPVRAGEVLAQLSNNYYKLEVDRAQAQYNQLLSKQGSAKDTGLLQAQLESAKANLGVIESQIAEIEAEQMGNDNTSDQSDNSSNSSSNYLQTLQKRKYAAEQQVREAEATLRLVTYNLDAARAELDQAKLRLAYTSIKSPISGIVAQRIAEEGLLVEPGQYLLSVVSLDDTWVVANIKESDFLDVKPGDPVDITVDAYPGQRFKGVVESLSPATGGIFALIPKDNASGNFIKVSALIPVRISFLNDPLKEFKLLPGMSAEVSIKSSTKAQRKKLNLIKLEAKQAQKAEKENESESETDKADKTNKEDKTDNAKNTSKTEKEPQAATSQPEVKPSDKTTKQPTTLDTKKTNSK